VVMVTNKQDSELIHPIGRCLCLGKPRYCNQLNAVTSSHRRLNLKNNKLCCSVSKNVSKQWTVHPALFPTMQVMNLPVFQPPTCSKMCVNPQYNPQAAISSTHLQSHRWSQNLHLDVSKQHQSDTICMKCLFQTFYLKQS